MGCTGWCVVGVWVVLGDVGVVYELYWMVCGGDEWVVLGAVWMVCSSTR